jgi:hypothetical protein
MIYIIEDSIHCEWQAKYSAFEDAVIELRRRASLPWDREPNQAPCTSWKTCGREYEILEYDDSSDPWTLIRRTPALEISATGIKWAEGFVG